MMKYMYSDGGKADAGLGKANSADCGIRAAAIAEDQGYRKTKAELNELLQDMTGGLQRSCNNGTPVPVLHKYLTDRGYRLSLTPNKYLCDLSDIMYLRLIDVIVIACIPRHFVCVQRGVVRDTWDSRKSNRTKCGSPKLEGYYFKSAYEPHPNRRLK